MAIYYKDFLEYIIIPTLKSLKVNSSSAQILLLGTASIESEICTFLKQIKGNALGAYQCEPKTYKDIFDNYLNIILYDQELRHRRDNLKYLFAKTCKLDIKFVKNGVVDDYHLFIVAPDPKRLMYDLKFSTAIARIHYLRNPRPLPKWNDAEEMASYHKKYYNTSLGKTDLSKSIEIFKEIIDKCRNMII